MIRGVEAGGKDVSYGGVFRLRSPTFLNLSTALLQAPIQDLVIVDAFHPEYVVEKKRKPTGKEGDSEKLAYFGGDIQRMGRRSPFPMLHFQYKGRKVSWQLGCDFWE
jgi:hypothetical protein